MHDLNEEGRPTFARYLIMQVNVSSEHLFVPHWYNTVQLRNQL